MLPSYMGLLLLLTVKFCKTEKIFTLYTEAMSWNDAKRICESNSQRLVNIDSEETSTALQSFLTKYWVTSETAYWTGLHDPDAGDKTPLPNYRSSSCHQLNWINWANDEPNYTGYHFCVRAMMIDGGKWRTLDCSEKFPFVCESEFDFKNSIIYASENQDSIPENCQLKTTTTSSSSTTTTITSTAATSTTTTPSTTQTTTTPTPSTETTTTSTTAITTMTTPSTRTNAATTSSTASSTTAMRSTPAEAESTSVASLCIPVNKTGKLDMKAMIESMKLPRKKNKGGTVVDHRPTFVAIGCSGLAICLGVTGLFVVSDFIKMYKLLAGKIRNRSISWMDYDI